VGTGHVGASLARQLAEAGAQLVLCDINRESVEALAKEIGATVVDPSVEIVDVDIRGATAELRAARR